MAWLSATQPLPRRPSRVLLAGTSGSGKSTLGRAISAALGIDYVELDALHHGPEWTVRAEFLPDVQRLADSPEWVTEWLYRPARPVLAARADLLVWLDLPRWLVMARLIRRTVRRTVRREVLWNGNVEPPLREFFTDRDHLVRWAWRQHPKVAQRVQQLAMDQPGLVVVRLRSPRDVARWEAGALRRVALVDRG